MALTVDELIAKFRHNAEGVIAPAQVDRCIEAAMGLDRVGNVRTLMDAARAAPAVAVRAA